ncbi:MAG TPA: sugar transferase [Candidatus Paceibacterota bacterium]
MAFSRRETFLLLAGDLILLSGSLWLALALRNLALPAGGYFLGNFTPFIPVFLVSLVVFYIAGLYEKPTRPNRLAMGGRIIGAQVANTLLAVVFFFLLPLSIAPKTILALYLVASTAAITAWHFYALSHFAPRERLRAVLVGTGHAVEEMAEELSENERNTIVLAARVDTATVAEEHIASQVREAVRAGARVVIADTLDPRVARALPVLDGALFSDARFVAFETLYEELFDRVPLAHIDYAWLLDRVPRQHALSDALKRVADIIGAFVVGAIALVFVIPAALVLAATGGTPFIFHERIGRDGRTFRIVKLRTMLFNDHGDPELQAKNRVTRFGAFLRKTRIDELPQLWNVLAGDLSFIGPRPELPRIAEVYEREIPYYHMRHLITPGLSGWAQILDYDAPRGGADVERTRRKLSYDLYYLKHRSLSLDAAIALKTLRALASLSGK